MDSVGREGGRVLGDEVIVMEDKTKLLVIGGVVLTLVFVLPALLAWAFGWGGNQPAGGWGMGPWMMWGGGWWFMPIFMILFWGLIVWGVVALVQGISRSSDSIGVSSRQESALEILKRRYARGEISKEEYQEKKGDLA